MARSLALWLFVTLPIIVLVAVIVGLIATGRPLIAPARLTAWAETRATEVAQSVLGPHVVVHAKGGADIVLETGVVPRVRLRGIELAVPGRPAVAVVDDLRVALDPASLMTGQVAPQRVTVRGARVDLVRTADGAVMLAGGAQLGGIPVDATGGAAAWGGGPQGGSPALSALRAVLSAPTLAPLGEARVEGLTVHLTDRATGRRWEAREAQLSFSRAAGQARASAEAALLGYALGAVAGAAPEPAGRVVIEAEASETGPAALVSASMDGVPAAALAAQHPSLAWLDLLDAPVSGALRGGVDPLGQVAPLDLTLTAGAGAIRPGGGAAPVSLSGARAALRFQPDEGRLVLRDLSLNSRALRLTGEGHLDLVGADAMQPEALVGQITLRDVAADPDGVFAAPARFDLGSADLRLRLAPLRLDIGQVTLATGDQRLTGRGQLRADDNGWTGALDFAADQITLENLLGLWPLELAGNTRRWLAQNVTTGSLRSARGAIRLAPGSDPVLSLSYAFNGAEVRVVNTLPPIRDGAGYATIQDNAHVLVVDQGDIAAPGRKGETIDVARSVLSVPDIRARPARAEAELHLAASIPAVLSLLDQPPFELLRKAGKTPDLAQGQAVVTARIGLPLLEKVPADQVDFDVTGTLRQVRSTTLVPRRDLRADSLRLTAGRRDGLRIAGRGTLSGVPFDAEWRHGFGRADRARSHLAGNIDITPIGLDVFEIALPKGMVTGTGRGRLEIDFIKDQPAPFRFSTDLVGLGLALPEAGWSKPAATAGRLIVEGAIPPPVTGNPARVDTMSIRAPGLSARGPLVLRRKDQGGGLARADLADVRLGDWFDGSVRLTGRGKGEPPGVEITSGRVDLTRAPLSRMARPKKAGPPMPVRLDRVQVTPTIFLTDVTARITSRADGGAGPFTGRLNDRAAVSGTITPGEGQRSAVALSSDDAGGVLAATGLFGKATGGRLAMRLDPARGAAGHYDGQLQVRGLRVAGTGALGSALTQGKAEAARTGEGIFFDRVNGHFRITPDAIEITDAAAIGPTLGLSAAGLFLPRSGTLHIKGVISPIFALNPGGGQSGEALFGFTYKLRGTAKAPEVSVNPASILAPGGLRDLFRRPAPTLDNLRPAPAAP